MQSILRALGASLLLCLPAVANAEIIPVNDRASDSLIDLPEGLEETLVSTLTLFTPSVPDGILSGYSLEVAFRGDVAGEGVSAIDGLLPIGGTVRIEYELFPDIALDFGSVEFDAVSTIPVTVGESFFEFTEFEFELLFEDIGLNIPVGDIAGRPLFTARMFFTPNDLERAVSELDLTGSFGVGIRGVLEIVQAPAPAALSLFGLGALALGLRRPAARR